MSPSATIAPLFHTTGEKPLLFTLELELLDAPLPIKRTLRIPSNMNLEYFQEFLMLAIRWEGYHLKEIRAGGITYFTRYAGGEDPESVEGFPQKNSFQFILGDLLKFQGDTFTFVYDMGDDWLHLVSLTDVLPCPTWTKVATMSEPISLAGKTSARQKMSAEWKNMPRCYNRWPILMTKNKKNIMNGYIGISPGKDLTCMRSANACGIISA